MPAHQARWQGGPSHGAAGVTPTPPLLVNVVDTIFNRLDGDADGSITQTEILAVVDPNGTRPTVADKVGAAFHATDTDASGALSRDEVSALITRLDSDQDGSLARSDRSDSAADAAAFDQASVLLFARHGSPAGGREVAPTLTVQQAIDAVFGRYDADASQLIPVTELIALLDPNSRHTELSTRLTALLSSIDSNGDASIDQTELGSALTAIDANADGLLQVSELYPTADSAAVELIGVLLHGGCHGADFGA